jgi:two-component system, cell cycle response regulator DivK
MKQRVLYIEKDKENQAQIRRIIDAAGYKFAGAATGRDGLAVVEGRGADLILLSFDLPDMDSFSLARQIRCESGTLEYTPIIAILADPRQGDAEKAFEAGCDEYIAEPINVIELCDRIATLLAGGSLAD